MKIVYEDDSVLVCEKEAGLPVETAQIAKQDLVSKLKNYLNTEYLGVVHRLDQPVRGLLVFGKTKEATAVLSKQLQEGSLNKEYLATVCGKVTPKESTLVDYLVTEAVTEKRNGRTSKGKIARVASEKEKDAKKAILTYRVKNETETEDGNMTTLSVHIETGRFHQIRVQLSHAGFPILGDQKYGNAESKRMSEKRGIQTVALIATEVSFIHPKTKKGMCFRIDEGK